MLDSLRRSFRLLPTAAALLVALFTIPTTAAQNIPEANNALVEDALVIPVPNPLTGEAVTNILDRINRGRAREDRPIRKIVFDFNPEDKDAIATDFGLAYSLANGINRLSDVSTIGFVHGKVTGHAVLPVLACKEVVMSKDSRLGPIAAESVPTVSVGEAGQYREILGESRANQLTAVRKMYDGAIALGKGFKNNGPWFVDLTKPDQIKAEGVINPQPLPYGPSGQPAAYDVSAAQDIGLCKLRAENRDELRDLYQISPSSFRDPLSNRSPVPFHYVLRGDVDRGTKESMDRLLTNIKARKGNVLYLELQCAGTDLDAARDLAAKLREHSAPPDGVQIIAFIPERAPDAATFVAFGCSEIVMSKRLDAADPNRPGENKEAEIGDFDAYLGKAGKNHDKADLYRQSLRELAEQQGYPAILVDGMFNRDLEIVRVHSSTDRTRRRLMTKDDLEADKDNTWVREKDIKAKGQLLKLNATLAAELGVARRTVDNRDIKEVYAADGVRPSEVREAEPGWLDAFAEFLKRPPVTIILVLVGFMGLILELKVPGLTVPGITAALCFILVFWSQSRFSGETFVLAMLLFLLGLVLVALEIFVLPGFGAPGVIGILFILSGLALVTLQQVPQTTADWGEAGSKMGQYLLAMVGAVFGAIYVARYLPNVPFANRMLLTPPMTKGGAAELVVLPGMEQAASLLGAMGTTNTALRPSGVVRFSDQFVDVVSEGGYIPPGVRVQVVEVEGTRIVVKEV